MADGMSAFGTTIALGDGASPEVFTTIAYVTNIEGPGLSADTIDVTSHGSTDGYRQFVQGLKDAGEVSLELNFDPDAATHVNASGGLAYEYEQGTESNYKITFPDTTVWTFPGIVTGLSPSAPMDGKLSAAVTIKVSGKPTLAAS